MTPRCSYLKHPWICMVNMLDHHWHLKHTSCFFFVLKIATKRGLKGTPLKIYNGTYSWRFGSDHIPCFSGWFVCRFPAVNLPAVNLHHPGTVEGKGISFDVLRQSEVRKIGVNVGFISVRDQKKAFNPCGAFNKTLFNMYRMCFMYSYSFLSGTVSFNRLLMTSSIWYVGELRPWYVWSCVHAAHNRGKTPKDRN